MDQQDIFFVTRWLWRVISYVWKVLKPVLFFTGLIYPLTLVIIQELTLIDIPIQMYGISWIIVIYVFIENVLKKITHNKKFKLYIFIYVWFTEYFRIHQNEEVYRVYDRGEGEHY